MCKFWQKKIQFNQMWELKLLKGEYNKELRVFEAFIFK